MLCQMSESFGYFLVTLEVFLTIVKVVLLKGSERVLCSIQFLRCADATYLSTGFHTMSVILFVIVFCFTMSCLVLEISLI